ncbi:VCBS domain-containing protein [Xanthobacter sp. 126]|uniref:VCBS domain-containing protein n=1 Tax=Xanthobacter sp. 126 TaxID=1131814 RepID=UPI00045EADE4|nr:VCBS domain-containing protein [Xanthobacter sp. 126]
MATKTKAPAFGGLDRSKTLAENTVNAGPVVLDSNVTLKNPDGTGFQGGSLSVKLANAGVDDHLSIAAVGGITLQTDAGTGTTSVFYNGARIGTETVSSSTITVSFDQPASDDAATALARAIAYSNPSNTPSAATHAVTFTAVDAEHSSISATMQLKVKAENDASVISNLGPVSSHSPYSAAAGFIIDGDAQVANADGTGFKGGKLTVHVDGATATDQLYLASGSFSVSGTKLMLDGKQVGTVSANGASGHDLAFTFKSNVAVSDAQMSALMDQVSYRSTAASLPTTTRDVTFTVTDAEKSAVSAHVSLVYENQAPTILSGSPAGGITLISVSASGAGGQGSSFGPTVSADGTEVAFTSYASNFAGETNTFYKEFYVKNLATGSVTLVSTNADGISGGSNTAHLFQTSDSTFSQDGHKVAFVSSASNLVPGDTNAAEDVFVKDIHTGAITRISTNSSGGQIDSWSGRPAFSPDGTKVVFESGRQDLPGDTDSSGLYVKDLVTGTTTQISINAPYVTYHTRGFNPTFSPDGTKIAFAADGNAGGPNLLGGSTCIYIKDLTTGDVTYVSAVSAHEVRPVFSPDGTKIAFVSNESSVVPGGEMWGTHLYVKDLQTGEITRVSAPGGVLPNDGVVGDQFAFSADGTKIVFSSSESTMPGNTNGASNIFVADLETGAITKVAANTTGISTGLAFTPDGAHVIFASDATDLVANDTNGATDLFMASIPATSVTSATLTEDAARKTLNAAGTFYFADQDAKDTHAVSVAAPEGALGTLSAKVVSDMNGTGAVVWSYVVDETKVEPLAAGQTKVETFALTLDDHHGGTVTQNVSVTLTGTGGSAPMVASFALAPETTTMAAASDASASGPDLWAAAMASLSGVGESLPGLFDVLEKRAATLEAAHVHGTAHDTAIAEVLQTLWSDISSHGAGPATAHDVAAGIEAVANHLREALRAGHDGGHLLV